MLQLHVGFFYWYKQRNCGGDHLKQNCLNLAEAKTQKNEGGKWCFQRAGEKCSDRKTKVKGRQLNKMFISLEDSTSGADFSKLGKWDYFNWHQIQAKEWGVQEFEGHTTVALHNSTGRILPLTWLLLNSQSTLDLIANEDMLVNTRTVRGKDAIWVHCNSGGKLSTGSATYPDTGLSGMNQQESPTSS